MKKKLLSVILAVAVAFTFSFAMVGTASATTTTGATAEFASDYSTAYVYLNGTYVGYDSSVDIYAVNNSGEIINSLVEDEATEENEVDVSEWHGLLMAQAVAGDADTTVEEYFYNLKGSIASGIEPVYESASLFASQFPNDEATPAITLTTPTKLANTIKDTEVKVTFPDTVVINQDSTAATQVFFNNYKATSPIPEEFDAESLAQQSVTVKTSMVPGDKEIDGSAAAPKILTGTSIADKAVRILASDAIAKFVIDADEGEGQPTLDLYDEDSEDYYTYDGKEHSVLMVGEGLTVTYSVFDWSKAAYGEYTATAPTFKDVTDKPLRFKAKVLNNKGNVQAETSGEYRIRVEEADIEYQFKTSSTSFFKTEEGYNAADFTKIVGGSYDKYNHVDFSRGELNKGDEATAAAIEANKADLEAYYADFYTINETNVDKDVNENGYSTVVLNIEPKNLKSAEEKELYAKYEQLIANFDLGYDDDSYIVLHVYEKVVEPADNAIEFTKAPLKKTYKANKKGKLAKTKNFTIKAEATAGTVTYEFTKGGSDIKINKETGKVTVKKGLKKGTYKVNVEATSAVEGYETVSVEYTLAVKIK